MIEWECYCSRHACSSDESGESFLLVIQSQEQKRLMAMYGNYMSMVDATYKTSKYELPLFFVVIKTNVDYQVVASFIVEEEKSDAIAEALAKLQEWNPTWTPQALMMDNCAAELKAARTCFPGNYFFPLLYVNKFSNSSIEFCVFFPVSILI